MVGKKRGNRFMQVIGSLAVSLLWGQLSTQFFFKGWISFLGLVYCFIGLIRNGNRGKLILMVIWSRVSEVVFFAVLLTFGFYILYFRLPLGRTIPETLVYFLSTAVRMLFLLPCTSKLIDDVIREVDEALFEKTKI